MRQVPSLVLALSVIASTTSSSAPPPAPVAPVAPTYGLSLEYFFRELPADAPARQFLAVTPSARPALTSPMSSMAEQRACR